MKPTGETERRVAARTSGRAGGLIALGLGGNLGDVEAALCRAIDELGRFLGPLEVAPLYRTAPVSPIPQGDFLNTVVLAARARAPTPEEILARAQALERDAGRRPGARFGPRPLDVELLFYGDFVLGPPAGSAELILPHPRLRRRRFVLAPLHDLRPALRLPPDGAAVADLLAALGAEQPVERIGWRSGGDRCDSPL